MAAKKVNTAQALLAHITLKTEALTLFGAKIFVREWTASERVTYMAIITNSKDDLTDEIAMIRPQAYIVALSMVDDKGKALFPAKWENDLPVFDDQAGVESLVQNRMQECYDAFVEVSKFNGVIFSIPDADEDEPEETAAKN